MTDLDLYVEPSLAFCRDVVAGIEVFDDVECVEDSDELCPLHDRASYPTQARHRFGYETHETSLAERTLGNPVQYAKTAKHRSDL